MTTPEIEERTFYPPIIEYLKKIGFQALGETTVKDKHPDILFKSDSFSFVIEVKLGNHKKFAEAVGQAFNYARRLNTNNVIILIYPEKYKKQPILFPEIIDRIALGEKVEAHVFTDIWTEHLSIAPKSLFEILKYRLKEKERKIDFKSVVKFIGNYVKELQAIVYQAKKEELISEVVDKLDLFLSIGELKNKKEEAEKQILNLASFLLFNQLLFYHIYKKKTNSKELPDLNPVKKIEEIQEYFDRITNIDYKAIYRINLLGHLPNNPSVIRTINEVIEGIKMIRAEYITHDLAGRFFHVLLPQEVRKVLAAFYTNPNAAEILAGLTIESYDESVIDPACGSGTLLISAYNKKLELYKKLYGFANIKKIHKKFVEEDITGIDIMPFAAHLTTINLSMQSIEYQTNFVRVATRDSLELAKNGALIRSEFFKRGIEIKPYTEKIIQIGKDLFYKGTPKKKKEGAISLEGKGETFYLKPVDVVIMNPPFTDRNKMTTEMRNNLKNNQDLGKICGHQINLWGYFIALADLLLKPGGKIGAVIPINIARGKATEKIRNFLLENYHIKYIVKPVYDIAFSEGASFRDVLLIAEKRKPKKDDITSIIFLKKSIRRLNEKDVSEIIKSLNKTYSEKNKVILNTLFEVWFIDFNRIKENKENLMVFLRGGSIKTRKLYFDFFDEVLSKRKQKLRKLNFEEMLEGFHASPEGLSELVFITNPIKKSRLLKNVIMRLEKEDKEGVHVKIPLNKIIKIPKKLVKPAIKTLTSISTLDITNTHDYIITDNFKGFNKILMFSKWKKNFTWNIVKKKLSNRNTYCAIQHRINMVSPNTHLIAVYSEKPFFTTHAFNIFKWNKNEAKIQTLLLNSIIGIYQLSSVSKETTGTYLEFMQSDLTKIYIFATEKLNKEDKKQLSNLFEKLKNVEFPSILEQLKNRFWARVELDKTILKVLGFTNKEINKWLPEVYDALIKELEILKKLT